MTKSERARADLTALGCPIGGDFHALSTEQVYSLKVAANVARYRKPKGANGSRLRYFHAALQRKAAGTR